MPERKGSDISTSPAIKNLIASPTVSDVPVHVAIIMDGNGRWAEDQGLSRLLGHHAGTENIRKVAQCAAEQGVKYLTLFAFSTENWSRPDSEVTGLLSLLGDVIQDEAAEMHRVGVRLNHLGRLDRLPPSLQTAIAAAVKLTQDNDGLVLSIAFDYGGRDEILRALKRMITDGLSPDQIDEATMERYLYTDDIPDPDLIVRTAGEMRLSNFLLWQAAYSEHYVTDVRWPDFDEGELLTALAAYSNRQRRFGGLSPSGAG